MKQLKLSILTLMVLAASFVLGDYASRVVTGQTTIANNAADMSGHIVMVADSATGRTVSNLFTFNRTGTNAPFAVGNVGAVTVTNLDADKLDGLDSTRFTWAEQTTTATGAQNNFAITSGQNTILYANNAAAVTFTGFTAGTAGQHLKIISVGAGQVNITPQSASSTAALRVINFATVSDTPLAAGSGTAEYVYDSGTARWRLVFHEQGAWITPTYAAGNYTGVAGTWTVDAGDVRQQRYRLSGRSLTVSWALTTTSVTAATTTLQIGNGGYGSFTAAGSQFLNVILYDDNGVGLTPTYGQIGSVSTTTNISVTKLTGTFAASANNTQTFGQITFEVN